MSYVGVLKCYVGLYKSYVGDKKSYVGDKKSYVGDKKSYVGDKKSYVGLIFLHICCGPRKLPYIRALLLNVYHKSLESYAITRVCIPDTLYAYSIFVFIWTAFI